MLVRDGRVTEDQVRDALVAQRHGGGRLGTVMVELGLIDLDALTIYLGLELGIPIASGAMLERAKRSAVRLLTPEQAYQFKCVPLIVQDRQLIAALEDPLDLELLDELSRVSGYRIIPRVAPEIRIYYYVERYYGVPRPARFVIFGDAPRGQNPPDNALPAPPLPGLPPVADVLIKAPTPMPILRTTRLRPPTPAPTLPEVAPPPVEVADDKIEKAFDDHEAIELEASDLLDEIDADAAARAEVADPATPTHSPGAPDLLSGPIEAESFAPLGYEQALAAMRDASDRGDVAEAIMAYAASLFDTAVLCIVRDNMAFGWKGFGPRVNRDRVETLLIPLEVPSMFQSAVHAALGDDADTGGNVLHDAPVPSTLHKHLFRVLRCTPPTHSTVAVLSIGKRVVNVLYGHRTGREELTDLELDHLRVVCASATNAYVRLIAVSRGGPGGETSGEYPLPR
jgi:hypothetical protein